MDGIAAITEERQRQIVELGYTAEHDKAHGVTELLDAARAYLVAAQGMGLSGLIYWPWNTDAFKPSADPLPNIAKAGALLAAAYDVEQGF